MKIAFIGGRDIHKLGGIETYMLNLCTELVKLGHTPIVYCESDKSKVESVNGFKVIHWKAPKSVYLCKIGLGLKSTLHSLTKEKGVEVFHYNAWPPSLWNWIPRLFGRTSLMMGHGLEWKRTKYSPRKQKIMRFMEGVTAHINNHLAMCSQEQTDYFAEVYHKSCTTIPTAVNIPDILSVHSHILEEHGIPPKYYFLYLGRLVQDKNPDFLIKSFSKANLKGFKLVMAGANNSNPEYVAKLHTLAAGNPNIIFTGAVYGADKEMLLKGCAFFCIPSTIEGLAITLLEAMSYGKICIASDIPANHEALGKSGIWCKYEDVDDLAEKMRYAAEHSSEITWQSEYNKDRIKRNFTWNIVAGKYVKFLNGLRQSSASMKERTVGKAE